MVKELYTKKRENGPITWSDMFVIKFKFQCLAHTYCSEDFSVALPIRDTANNKRILADIMHGRFNKYIAMPRNKYGLMVEHSMECDDYRRYRFGSAFDPDSDLECQWLHVFTIRDSEGYEPQVNEKFYHALKLSSKGADMNEIMANLDFVGGHL